MPKFLLPIEFSRNDVVTNLP